MAQRQTGMGIKLDPPIKAVELRQGHDELESVTIHGARRSNARSNAAAWQGEYPYSSTHRGFLELFPVHGRVFERPDNDTLAAVQTELTQIDQERRAALPSPDRPRASHQQHDRQDDDEQDEPIL